MIIVIGLLTLISYFGTGPIFCLIIMPIEKFQLSFSSKCTHWLATQIGRYPIERIGIHMYIYIYI